MCVTMTVWVTLTDDLPWRFGFPLLSLACSCCKSLWYVASNACCEFLSLSSSAAVTFLVSKYFFFQLSRAIKDSRGTLRFLCLHLRLMVLRMAMNEGGGKKNWLHCLCSPWFRRCRFWDNKSFPFRSNSCLFHSSCFFSSLTCFSSSANSFNYRKAKTFQPYNYKSLKKKCRVWKKWMRFTHFVTNRSRGCCASVASRDQVWNRTGRDTANWLKWRRGILWECEFSSVSLCSGWLT